MDFEQTAPVKRTKSGGKTAAENPFTKAVADIALKTYTEGEHKGKPIALKYVERHKDEAAVKTDRNRIRRQTSDAGEKNDPQVTVNTDFQDANAVFKEKGKERTEYASLVTFWTIPRTKRASKKTTPAASGTTVTDVSPTK